MHAEPIQRQQEGVPGGEEQLLDKRRAKMTETSSLVETFFSNMKSISYHDPWLKSGRRQEHHTAPAAAIGKQKKALFSG
jgi:hypothetical protein